VIPPQANAAFVCAMEDVLEVYTRPYTPKRPQVCMDEKPLQLIEETRVPVPARRGREARVDFEYRRAGTADVWMFYEPLAGRRHVEVSRTRTTRDWAEMMRTLSDEVYPDAEVIVVVLDNLNTHRAASFYEVFAPEEARRLVARFEFHYTPKHGSWLNMAEIELSVISRQSLKRRIPTLELLAHETRAWAQRRNDAGGSVDWRFTTEDARIKLKKLYPSISA
jgi:hypothetical protein